MSQIIVHDAKRNLFLLWCLSTVFLILIFIFQTIMKHYDNNVAVAWGWLSASIGPSIINMTSIFFSDTDKSAQIEKSIYCWAFGISSFYLVIIYSLVILQPFTTTDPLKIYQEFSIVLGLIQGIVNVALGYVFQWRGKK